MISSDILLSHELLLLLKLSTIIILWLLKASLDPLFQKVISSSASWILGILFTHR